MRTCIHMAPNSTCLEANQLSLQESIVYQFSALIYEPVFCGYKQKKCGVKMAVQKYAIVHVCVCVSNTKLH